jgi:hypothetical protein
MLKIIEEMDLKSLDLAGKDVFFLCGMPGIGSVGKLVIETMVVQLKAQLAVTIYFDDFPSQVIVEPGGKLLLPTVQIFLATPNETSTFLLMTGDFQPSSNIGIYGFVDGVMNYLTKEKDLKLSLLLSTGAYVPDQVPLEPKIYVSATDLVEMEKLVEIDPEKVNHMEGGIITGANGIIPAWGLLIGIPGICMLAETIPMVKRDPKAARIILETLAKRFSIEMDLSDLDAMSDEMDKNIDDLKRRAGIMPESKEEESGTKARQSYIG